MKRKCGNFWIYKNDYYFSFNINEIFEKYKIKLKSCILAKNITKTSKIALKTT
jgi:hypothetical protein